MPEFDEGFLRANAEVNEVFGNLQRLVEERAAGGADQLSVLETAREARLEIDDRVLEELHLPEFVPVQRFLPSHIYFPVYPLLCWYWRRRWPWYQCPCNWWWWRCYWWER